MGRQPPSHADVADAASPVGHGWDRRDDGLPRPRGPRALSANVGHAPSSPWRFSAREWASVFKRALQSFLADDAMGMSAQVAFSSLLAFFPAMVFLVGLLDLLGAYETLQEFLAPVAPGDVLDTIDTLQRETSKGSSVVAFIVGAAGATWAASGAMGAVIKAVNRAYDQVETRPFWRTRIIAIVLVALTGLVLAGLLLLIVFGGPLGTAIADKAHLGGAFELVWTVLRWPIAFVAVLLFFALVYYLAPNVDARSWKWLTPGSLVGAVSWLALSGLFALYTSFSDSYSKTYGALASGIVLLLWLNYSAFALLFGAELNSELDRQAEIRAAGGEDAGLIKPSRRV